MNSGFPPQRPFPRDLEDLEDTPLAPFPWRSHADLIWPPSRLAVRQWKPLDTGGEGGGAGSQKEGKQEREGGRRECEGREREEGSELVCWVTPPIPVYFTIATEHLLRATKFIPVPTICRLTGDREKTDLQTNPCAPPSAALGPKLTNWIFETEALFIF